MKKYIIKKSIFTLLILFMCLIESNAKNNKKENKINFAFTNSQGPILNSNQKGFLHFNGNNSYGIANGFIEGLEKTTLMGWISLSPDYHNDAFIMGENNFNISCTANRKIVIKCNSITLNSSFSLDTSRWYHLAVTYNGSRLKFYLNGKLMQQLNADGALQLSENNNFTIGKNPSQNSHYFKGKIDEIRVFNECLSDTHIQQMVYQEITNNNGLVTGITIPKNFTNLYYSALIRYYKMDLIQNNIAQNQTQNTPDNTEGIQLFNFSTIEAQEAPMPFVTKRIGNFTSAIHDDTMDIFGKDSEIYPWAIIQVSHDITQYANVVNFGLIIDSGKKITLLNDIKIENQGYVKLDGKIDLEGKSQFIQTTESILDPISSGLLERDQQGQSNQYNYNYWSSPVSTPNSSTINHGYTVAGVMKDGSNSQPQNIAWVNSMNNPTTSNPITLSTYWIYKFQDITSVYANWSMVGQNGLLQAGQGYTLKGSGVDAPFQNYTFIGKPNNGTITIPVSPNNLNLTGNPYPSALDAHVFIKDNINTINGTLYFWEHSAMNNTHNLSGYQGGYGAITLVGGIKPMTQIGENNINSFIKTPGRFIPVGQGFFVTGNNQGGLITFQNSQRLFIKEVNQQSFNLFRQTSTTSIENNQLIPNNAEESFEDEPFAKIKIGFNSHNNYHREILLGFMNEWATDNIDPGYDAIHIDNQQNDMFFMNDSNKLVIQGVGYFDVTKKYPLGVKTYEAGNVQFTLDEVMNWNENIEIFILDKTTGIHHPIQNGPFTVYLPQGELNNRFELTFSNQALSNSDFSLSQEIGVAFSNAQNLLTIQNNLTDVAVKTVNIITILGQTLATWNVENETQTNISLPVSQASSGTYIVRMQTTAGTISKKIIIK
jgi:hypothetical protein